MFAGVAPLHMTDVFLAGGESAGWEREEVSKWKTQGPRRFREEGAEPDSGSAVLLQLHWN